MSLIRIFQIALRGGVGGWVRENPPCGGGMGNLARSGFSSVGEHLRRCAFDHSNLFQMKKHSVYIEHQSVCPEYEVKMKIVQEQWLQLKMKFLLVCYMKICI